MHAQSQTIPEASGLNIFNSDCRYKWAGTSINPKPMMHISLIYTYPTPLSTKHPWSIYI